MSWLETYRGTVYRWEVDNVDHFTVAYYFARFEDATLGLLHALGLDTADSLADTRRSCVTIDCHVRYLREFRVGDIFHVQSGVIRLEEGGLLLGHQLVDSEDGALCTTVAQRVALVEVGARAPFPLTDRQREAAASHRVEWTPAPEPTLEDPGPEGEDGFLDTTRDSIKSWEVDVHGEAAFPAFIHRFSAANAHALARFGMTPGYMKREGRGFSTFEFKLRFPGAVRAGDLVRVRTGLLHVGNSSVRLLHRMVDARTGRIVSTLEQSGVHLDLAARRPAPLPDALKERAQGLLVAGGKPPGRS